MERLNASLGLSRDAKQRREAEREGPISTNPAHHALSQDYRGEVDEQTEEEQEEYPMNDLAAKVGRAIGKLDPDEIDDDDEWEDEDIEEKEKPQQQELTPEATHAPTSKLDRRAMEILTQDYGVDTGRVESWGKPSKGLRCPKCRTHQLDAVEQWDGNGGWWCKNPLCRWHHAKDDKLRAVKKVPELKDYLGVPAFLMALCEDHTSRAAVTRQLIFLAGCKGTWHAFYVTDPKLIEPTRQTDWHIRQTKKWLEGQPWIRWWRGSGKHGLGRVTWYSINPELLLQAFNRLVGADDASFDATGEEQAEQAMGRKVRA